MSINEKITIEGRDAAQVKKDVDSAMRDAKSAMNDVDAAVRDADAAVRDADAAVREADAVAAAASAEAEATAEAVAEAGDGRDSRRSTRVIRRAESVADNGIVISTDMDDESRATQTIIGFGLVLGGIILLLLSLVVTKYTIIGVKRYVQMNLSLLKGN